MKNVFLILFSCLLLPIQKTEAQIYADSQSIGYDSLCVGCGVVNPQNSIDGSYTTYSQLDFSNNLPDTIDAFIYQNLIFSSPGATGEMIHILVQSPDSIPLDSLTLSGVNISTLIGGVSNSDTINSTKFNISLLSGSTSKYIVEFQATNNFDAVQVLLNAGALGSVDSLNIFYAMRTDLVLPVELLDFHAELINHSVNLFWSTATETNNDFFTIEASVNGTNFHSIGIIKGSGNSLMEKKYSFVDTKPLQGFCYYRLKQTDYNGKFKYFKIIFNQYTETTPKFTVYPNPLSEQNLNVSFITSTDAMLNVYNTTGELLFSKGFPVDQVNSEKNFNCSNFFEAGTYYIKLITNNTVQTKILVVQK
jgi:hypothetical protein